MIKVRKLDKEVRVNVCNGCNKVNKPRKCEDRYFLDSFSSDRILPENNDDVYECIIQGNKGCGGFCINLCSSCARELLIKLYKQIEEEKE